MSIIAIEGIRLYAFHGCMDEEGKVGSHYEVNVKIEADVEKSTKTDHLADTVDYVHVYEIVKEEMAIRSKLIEHVAKRILDKLKNECKNVQGAEVTLYKLDPPIHGIVKRVGITLKA
jgi:7,8-dihydroneopterin aldolase/epimerase/oxygenase